MNAWTVIGTAVALGADAMSVSAAVGVRWHGARQKFRLAWHMGLFQFLMPLVGALIGQEVAGLLASVGKYIAAVLVAAVGVKMFIEAWRNHPGEMAESAEHALESGTVKDPTRGWSLMVLSVATSLDALVVGFSLGVREGAGPIVFPSAVIGVVAAGMSLSGVVLGRRFGRAVGRPAEFIGALVLVVLAVLMVAAGSVTGQ